MTTRKLKSNKFERNTALTSLSKNARKPLLLTFDAFDTLFTPVPSVPTQYAQEVFSHTGIRVKESDIKASFAQAFKYHNNAYPNYGKATKMTPDTWWMKVITSTVQPLLPRNTTFPEQLSVDLYGRFSSKAGYELFPDVLPFLSLLGQPFHISAWPPTRTILGVVSNSDPRVRTILSSLDINISPSVFPLHTTTRAKRDDGLVDGPAHFAFATLSYEVGSSKPDSAIWDAALSTAQDTLNHLHQVSRLTRNCMQVLQDIRQEFRRIHVGDELEKDVLPAIRAGWEAVHLDRKMDAEAESWEVEGCRFLKVRSLDVLRFALAEDLLPGQAEEDEGGVDEDSVETIKTLGGSTGEGTMVNEESMTEGMRADLDEPVLGEAVGESSDNKEQSRNSKTTSEIQTTTTTQNAIVGAKANEVTPVDAEPTSKDAATTSGVDTPFLQPESSEKSQPWPSIQHQIPQERKDSSQSTIK